MTDREALAARIRDIHTSMGGRATPEQMEVAVLNSLSDEERAGIVTRWLKTAISTALRSKNGDLAFAQSIAGTYVQLSLMDEGEYRFVVRQHLNLSENHRTIAAKYVAHCAEHLGVDISDELAA